MKILIVQLLTILRSLSHSALERDFVSSKHSYFLKLYTGVILPQALDDWTHFFLFFLHFHSFGDPYDMFMQLFYLKNLFYQSSINPRLWATI